MEITFKLGARDGEQKILIQKNSAIGLDEVILIIDDRACIVPIAEIKLAIRMLSLS